MEDEKDIVLNNQDDNGNSNSDISNNDYSNGSNKNNNMEDVMLVGFEGGSQSQATQNIELTQLADFDDLEQSNSQLLSPLPPQSPINPLTIPWARLTSTSTTTNTTNMCSTSASETNRNDHDNIAIHHNLLPRPPLTPCDHTSKNALQQQQQQQQQQRNIQFLGLSLNSSDRFNEYIVGRSAKCDIKVPKRNDNDNTNSNNDINANHDKYVHSMISNTHCRIFCLLKNANTNDNEMEVYIEDSSGNGTFINNTTLLKRNERRLLHTGDTICLLNPKIIQKKVRNVLEQKDILNHYSFVFINLFHQQQQQHQRIGGAGVGVKSLGTSIGLGNHHIITKSLSCLDSDAHDKRRKNITSLTNSHDHHNEKIKIDNNNDKMKQNNATKHEIEICSPTSATANDTNTKSILMISTNQNNNSHVATTTPSTTRKRGLVDVRSTNTKRDHNQCYQNHQDHDQKQTNHTTKASSSSSSQQHPKITCPNKRQCVEPKKHLNVTTATATQLKNASIQSVQQQQQQQQQRHVESEYDIRDEIGSGTCGQVRRAINRKTGEMVAIKIISLGTPGNRNRMSAQQQQQDNPKNNPNDAFVDKIIKEEASILQSLDHPYIVKLIDIFIRPGKAVYLVMELLHGGDLFDRIVEKGHYTEIESRRVMRRLFAAIYHLHEVRDIVHRDLKPENILCVSRNDDVTVKLTDFGLAKSITEDGLKTFCGTPQYFAPEVLRRRHSVAGHGRYGREADMWSLGVILYILICGCPPFDASSAVSAVEEAKISFRGRRWDGISQSAKELITMLLETDPTKRISVVDACRHSWILTEDGDTHLHPLEDPTVKMHSGLVKDNDAVNEHHLYETKERTGPSKNVQSSPSAPQSVLESPLPERKMRVSDTSPPKTSLFVKKDENSEKLDDADAGKECQSGTQTPTSPGGKAYKNEAQTPNQAANFPFLSQDKRVHDSNKERESLFSSIRQLSNEYKEVESAKKQLSDVQEEVVDLSKNPSVTRSNSAASCKEEVGSLENDNVKVAASGNKPVGAHTVIGIKGKQATLSKWFEKK